MVEAEMAETARMRGFWYRVGPALTLIFLSPIIAEILPGATRMSAIIFALPSELGMWGVGALLIRALVRRYRLGWLNMLLLALVLSLAEECVIQQTSLAPMVLEVVKGPPYARDFGVNWLYLLWALGYESVLVVILPVMLTELIFSERRNVTWVSGWGVAIALFYFTISCLTAWASWTQYVRPNVFHVPLYTPPLGAVMIALSVMLVLVLLALGPFRRLLAQSWHPLPLPPAWVIGGAAFFIAVFWYGLVLLSFRVQPNIPPLSAAAAGIVVALSGLVLFARWSANPTWGDGQRYAIVFGGVLGSMSVSFISFIGAIPLDLYGKAIVDAVAIILLIVLWMICRLR
jgi:hypothetical protein